ncbi:MAG: hypothetical protein FWD15_04480 [Alphaproteobacteria bacterium]|nr:hypothetical protein [Alphaproteobacteria bacterium]
MKKVLLLFSVFILSGCDLPPRVCKNTETGEVQGGMAVYCGRGKMVSGDFAGNKWVEPSDEEVEKFIEDERQRDIEYIKNFKESIKD